MTDATDPCRKAAATLAAARVAPVPPGQRSAPLFAHGSMTLRFYRPRGEDLQTPHEQDELYFVAAGSGWFRNGAERHQFGSGDVLFVAAGVPHRFEEFSSDFAAWVVFWGPKGGER
jgi:mannose-6-phosphate isomerase-like protein (cupin superfamily)